MSLSSVRLDISTAKCRPKPLRCVGIGVSCGDPPPARECGAWWARRGPWKVPPDAAASCPDGDAAYAHRGKVAEHTTTGRGEIARARGGTPPSGTGRATTRSDVTLADKQEMLLLVGSAPGAEAPGAEHTAARRKLLSRNECACRAGWHGASSVYGWCPPRC